MNGEYDTDINIDYCGTKCERETAHDIVVNNEKIVGKICTVCGELS